MNPHDVQDLFSAAPGSTYLDSATYGLPPKATIEALDRALRGWQSGEASWKEDWDREGEVCRRLFAEMISSSAAEVALMPALSVATGIVASSVPARGEVLLAEGDFTSMVYPFLAAEQRGLLSVREAPLEELAEAVREQTALVAVSLVQSADGRAADLMAISAAARAAGARLYVDASQCLGVMPVHVGDFGIDFLSCAAYKWLCCPRGVAFLYVREPLWDEPMSIAASWRGGDDPYGRFYGTPLRLSPTAARFDVSLAWHAWVGARASLEVLSALGDATRFALATEPVRHLADLLGLPHPPSTILSVPVTDARRAGAALEAARIRVSVRDSGQIRVSSHIYNSEVDAERAAEILEPFVQHG